MITIHKAFQPTIIPYFDENESKVEEGKMYVAIGDHDPTQPQNISLC